MKLKYRLVVNYIKSNIKKTDMMVKIIFSIFPLLFSFLLFSQEQTITVIGSGDGVNITAATNQALRNCIEKSMGAFLSSSTVVSNDELVKDEIVTIASGNIVSYQILSELNLEDNYNVTVSAIISPEQLITTLKAKGFNFELNGGVYAQNILKEKFYAEQEKVALQNFLTTWEKVQLFEFDIKITEPKAITKTTKREYNHIQNPSQEEGIKELKESFENSIKTTLASYNINSIYSDIDFDLKFKTNGANGNGNINYQNEYFPSVSDSASYSMFALFTPKITTTYTSFIKSLITLLNSISIKDIDSYKNLNPKYLAVNIAISHIDANKVKNSGLDFSSYMKNESGDVVFYLRNPADNELLVKLSELIDIKSTASNFTSESVGKLINKPVLLFDSNMSPNYSFYDGPSDKRMTVRNPTEIHPFYSDVITSDEWVKVDDFYDKKRVYIESFRPTIYWIFLTFEELQNLKKIEFKLKE